MSVEVEAERNGKVVNFLDAAKDQLSSRQITWQNGHLRFGIKLGSVKAVVALFDIEVYDYFMIADELETGRIEGGEEGKLLLGGMETVVLSGAVELEEAGAVLDLAHGRLEAGAMLSGAVPGVLPGGDELLVDVVRRVFCTVSETHDGETIRDVGCGLVMQGVRAIGGWALWLICGGLYICAGMKYGSRLETLRAKSATGRRWNAPKWNAGSMEEW